MIKCNTVPTRCYGPNYPDCKINRPLLGPAIHIKDEYEVLSYELDTSMYFRVYEKRCYICSEIYSYREPIKKLTDEERQKIINNTNIEI